MFDFTSLLFPLILTWMLTFTDVQTFREETVRVGDEVTLKCENANNFSDGCSRITWIYSHSTKSTFALFEDGKIHKDVGSKSDRLSVTENCSLVIKKITDEDAGIYTCRQFSTSGQKETEFWVELTVRNAESSATTESVLQTLKPSDATEQLTDTKMTALIIAAAVIVAACIIFVGMFLGWRRIKAGRKTQIEANTTPPEDSYASISFSKNTNNRPQVLDKVNTEDAVIYSAVKVSSSAHT
ncbi:hypothetical protein OJAV_G00070900 [Oryzias javanicus]|uniref:Ig-like domain-containing protein n=1 Tax=Oryzias javanicus TaxID=123683 RepID=A0A3S2PVU4_ORYJA|nr:hypothetical protein OJAV_G00070900 [Oryzias javanicus]